MDEGESMASETAIVQLREELRVAKKQAMKLADKSSQPDADTALGEATGLRDGLARALEILTGEGS